MAATDKKNTYVSEENMKQFCEGFKQQFAPKTSQSGSTSGSGFEITEARTGIIEDVYWGFDDYISCNLSQPIKYLEVTDGFGTLFIWYNGNVLYDEMLQELGFIEVNDYDFHLGWFCYLDDDNTDLTMDLHWKAFA